MSYPSRDEILASSKGWVASFLNFLPGLGSGYLYQRRWKPYFFTITASIAWFALGFFFQAEDGIRDLPRSRGLGDVYKRQVIQSLLKMNK